MTTRHSWVQDHCTDSNMPVDERHARGLLKIHASCEPPCPRKLSAQRYLRERSAADGSTGQADGAE
ncbi:hypothetical protein ACWESM_12310 [Nocardia sp. NPDC003999]